MVASTTPLGDMLHNIDFLTLVATIVIALIGWIVALALQRWNIKKEHQVEVRYDIYKQLVTLRTLNVS
jgi:hypothetical protein